METTTTPVTSTSVGLRYGLLTGRVSVILSFILFVTHADQSPARWLGLIILIGAMVLAHKTYKQANEGFMSYAEGLGIGAFMSGVSGVISTAFSVAYMKFIDPEYMSRATETARANLEAKGGLTDEQIEQGVAMMQKFSTTGWMVLFGILGSVLGGLLIALIVSAFTKHSKPEFE